MLRILVISLFVLNLLLFGFWDNEPQATTKGPAKPVVSQNSNVPTIHLFSEMMQDQGLLSDNRQCFSLGPFHSVDDLDEVYASLVEQTVTISERQTQALVEKGYWAYLSPYSSLLEANEVLLSLEALGLKDIAVIYNGEWTNAISLGYFLRQENAVRRKKSLEDRGYTPLIRVQRQAEDRYWLDYEQTPGSDLIALNMQGRPNDFMQRSLPCPEREVIEEPVVQLVEQVATAVQLPDPEPVEIPAEEPVSVAEQQDEEPQIEESLEQEAQQDDVDTSALEDTAQLIEDAVIAPPEDEEPQSANTDDISSAVADPQPEDIQLDSDTESPVTIDAEAAQEILSDDLPTESEPVEIDGSVTEQDPETIFETADGTEPEADPETEPETEEELDPYDGDDFDFDLE